MSKPRFILSLCSWIYVFGIAGLMIFGQIRADGVSVGTFIIFLLIAGSASTQKRINNNDLKVRVNGELFEGDQLEIYQSKDGKTFVLVKGEKDPKKERSERKPAK